MSESGDPDAATRTAFEADLTAGRRLHCPLLLIRGLSEFPDRHEMQSAWAEIASQIEMIPLDCGHFVAEEAPDQTFAALACFLGGSARTQPSMVTLLGRGNRRGCTMEVQGVSMSRCWATWKPTPKSPDAQNPPESVGPRIEDRETDISCGARDLSDCFGGFACPVSPLAQPRRRSRPLIKRVVPHPRRRATAAR
jgi:hypothetical protein